MYYKKVFTEPIHEKGDKITPGNYRLNRLKIQGLHPTPIIKQADAINSCSEAPLDSFQLANHFHSN